MSQFRGTFSQRQERSLLSPLERSTPIQFEVHPKAEKTSGVVRIIGGTEPDRVHAQESFNSVFRHQEPHRRERPKTPEELELIQQINERMREFVGRYGGTPVNLSPEHIHFIEATPSTTNQERPSGQNMSCHGFYNPDKQEIVIYADKDVAPLWRAIVLVHEMIHFNSFQEYILTQNTNDQVMARPHRVGLDVLKFHNERVTALFRDLHEAVVTELTKRFDREYFENIEYTKADTEYRNSARRRVELEKSGEPMQEGDAAVYLTRKQPDGTVQMGLERYDYTRERKAFWNLVDQIFEHNRATFGNREEVFSLFAKAVLADSTDPLIDIVDKTFGRGFWQSLGEKTAYGTRKGIRSSPDDWFWRQRE